MPYLEENIDHAIVMTDYDLKGKVIKNYTFSEWLKIRNTCHWAYDDFPVKAENRCIGKKYDPWHNIFLPCWHEGKYMCGGKGYCLEHLLSSDGALMPGFRIINNERWEPLSDEKFVVTHISGDVTGLEGDVESLLEE